MSLLKSREFEIEIIRHANIYGGAYFKEDINPEITEQMYFSTLENLGFSQYQRGNEFEMFCAKNFTHMPKVLDLMVRHTKLLKSISVDISNMPVQPVYMVNVLTNGQYRFMKVAGVQELGMIECHTALLFAMDMKCLVVIAMCFDQINVGWPILLKNGGGCDFSGDNISTFISATKSFTFESINAIASEALSPFLAYHPTYFPTHDDIVAFGEAGSKGVGIIENIGCNFKGLLGQCRNYEVDRIYIMSNGQPLLLTKYDGQINPELIETTESFSYGGMTIQVLYGK